MIAGRAEAADWPRQVLDAGGRPLAFSISGPAGTDGALVVVIEGDGRIADARGRPTADPTPKDPEGLAIARAWPASAVAWLARPCQYTRAEDAACSPKDWTDGRFTAAAAATMDAGVEALKAKSGARQVLLVGWSGGGVLAMLIAARRSDVAGVATFAAPLDLAAWTAWHRMGRPAGWLDPALQEPPAAAQVHMFGAFDPVVPARAMTPAAERLVAGRGVVVVHGERHDCCWARRADEAAKRLADNRRDDRR